VEPLLTLVVLCLLPQGIYGREPLHPYEHIGQTPDGMTLLLLNRSSLELVSYELP